MQYELLERHTGLNARAASMADPTGIQRLQTLCWNTAIKVSLLEYSDYKLFAGIQRLQSLCLNTAITVSLLEYSDYSLFAGIQRLQSLRWN